MVKAKPHNKTEDLILKIKEVMGSLDRDTVAKAYNSFQICEVTNLSAPSCL